MTPETEYNIVKTDQFYRRICSPRIEEAARHGYTTSKNIRPTSQTHTAPLGCHDSIHLTLKSGTRAFAGRHALVLVHRHTLDRIRANIDGQQLASQEQVVRPRFFILRVVVRIPICAQVSQNLISCSGQARFIRDLGCVICLLPVCRKIV